MKVGLVKVNKELRKFQEGGAMPAEAAGAPEQGMPAEGAPAEAGAPAEGQGGDPMQEILQAAMQAVQNNDAQLALQVCAALVQLAQGGAEGGAPAEGAPEGEPVYRKGGRLAYRRK